VVHNAGVDPRRASIAKTGGHAGCDKTNWRNPTQRTMGSYAVTASLILVVGSMSPGTEPRTHLNGPWPRRGAPLPWDVRLPGDVLAKLLANSLRK
jgi:hypothetical protein